MMVEQGVLHNLHNDKVFGCFLCKMHSYPDAPCCGPLGTHKTIVLFA